MLTNKLHGYIFSLDEMNTKIENRKGQSQYEDNYHYDIQYGDAQHNNRTMLYSL
jgi:hypothetical protein